MKTVEQFISPLIDNLFPDFYRDEGQNFVAFVKAYYEFLESHYQFLILEDLTGFSVGDTVTQELVGEDASGTIVYVDDVESSVLVYTTTTAPFRCKLRCNVLSPFVSSGGGSTYIEESGSTNPLFHSRKVMKYRDIDNTIDRFVVHFKEKYLKNIQFDVATNRPLVVKNSLNLYRSKGTERGIDLFFKLIYGTKAEIYVPGEHVLKPSDGQWFKPIYLSVSATDRSVDLVGKVIRGQTSGAEAFVEKFIRIRSRGIWVNLLYISNMVGEFVKDEVVGAEKIYSDSPVVFGSLKELNVTNGGSNFVVGDLVNLSALQGSGGQARVTSITDISGFVDFSLFKTGYGYTIDAQELLSLQTLRVSNVATTTTEYFHLLDVVSQANTKGRIVGISSNVALSVTDASSLVTVGEECYQVNANNEITANGTVAQVSLTAGTGFITLQNYSGVFTNSVDLLFRASNTSATFVTLTTDISVANVVGNSQSLAVTANSGAPLQFILSTGNTANLHVGDLIRDSSNLAVVNTYNAAKISSIVNSTAFIVNNSLIVANGSANIVVTNTEPRFGATLATANLTVSSNTSNTTLFVLTTGNTSDISTNDVISGSSNTQIVNTSISSKVASIVNSTAFTSNSALTLANGSVTLSVSNTSVAQTTLTNTSFYIDSSSLGKDGEYNVIDIDDTEVAWFNTDLVFPGNTSYLNTALAAATYGFPKFPSANANSYVLSALDIQARTIGSIGLITTTNPGEDYTADPVALLYEPRVAGSGLKDYYLKVEGIDKTFVSGETILQRFANVNTLNVVVSNTNGFTVGDLIYSAANNLSNGILSYVTSNTLVLVGVSNSAGFTAGNNAVSFSNTTANQAIVSVTSGQQENVARGKVISVGLSGSNDIFMQVERLSVKNFIVGSNVVGTSSGATGNLTISQANLTTASIGLDAVVNSTALISAGLVTGLEVLDSGLGYSNGALITFTSLDGENSGTATAFVEGTGQASGFYKNNKGFLSADKYIYDGDYYQEYSYDVMSRLSIDKYKEMFMKVMHVAGTKMFGSVQIEDKFSVPVTIAESVVEQE